MRPWLLQKAPTVCSTGIIRAVGVRPEQASSCSAKMRAAATAPRLAQKEVCDRGSSRRWEDVDWGDPSGMCTAEQLPMPPGP